MATPPDAQGLQWVTVNDFSQGIVQQASAGNSVASSFYPTLQKVGSAFDALDCVSLPGTGALGPAPFHFQSFYTGPVTLPDGANNLSGFCYVTGLHVPKYLDGNVKLFTTLGYAFNNAGPIARRYRLYEVNVSSVATEIQNTVGALPFFQTANGANVNQCGFTPICDYRSNGAGAPTTPGQPLVIIGIADPDLTTANIFKFPGAPVTRVGAYSAINSPVHLLPHQGRLVVNGSHTTFTLDQVLVHNDDTFWTQANLDAYDNGGATSSLSQAVVGSYGIMASQSASEMIVIRTSSKGGMTISGDLNDPIITNYDTMQGTNGVHMEGVWTPQGYVYGEQSGAIHMYMGGGRSQNISKQLDWGFWDFSMEKRMKQFGGQYSWLGKCAYISGFVFVPNNFFYDTSNSSWWRFTSCGQFVHYIDTDPLGNIFTSPCTWTPGNDLVQISGFGNAAPTYNWTSNLIPLSTDDGTGEIREFMLSAVSYGSPSDTETFQVVITVYPSLITKTLNMSIAAGNSYPQTIREIFNALVGTHCSVKITATNTPAGTSHQAPVLNSFSIGVAARAKVKAT